MRDAGLFLRCIGFALLGISVLVGIKYIAISAMVLFPLGVVFSETANERESNRIDYLEEKMFEQNKEEDEE